MNKKWIIGAVVVILVVALGGFFMGRLTSPINAPTSTPTPTPTNTPTPTETPTVTPTPTPTAPAGYPLAGQVYFSNRNPQGNKNPSLDPYYAIWDNNGWLHQPNLPPEGQRSAFDIALTIENGNYTFSGVSCDLYLDTERTGKGAVGKPTLGRGNNLLFVVNTKDGGQAWATVVCKDNDKNGVVGFSIQYQGPLH